MQNGEDTEIVTEPPRCPFRVCDPPSDFSRMGEGRDFEYNTTTRIFTYVKCPKCGLVVNATLPVPQEMARIYPNNYYSFSDSNGENPLFTALRNQIERAKAAQLRQLIGKDTAAVVDIGCGVGRMLDMLASQGSKNWRFAGVEIGADAAATARQKGYDVRAGDFDFLDLSDWEGRFDLAVMHQVIEHTRYPRDTLGKANALLAPGGFLSIETPDLNSWDRRIFGGRYWGGWHIPRHFFIFDKKSLSSLAEIMGFEIVSVRSITSPACWILSIHNMMTESRYLRRFANLILPENPALSAVATLIDLVQIKLFGTSSNMQIILRKIKDAPA